MIRLLTIEDYDEIYCLWKRTPGIGLRSLDDSREGIEKFIKRNPDTSFVAVEDGVIAGTILGGHDGRRGYIYHACVDTAYRRRSIGRQLSDKVLEAIKAEGISRIALFAKENNSIGNDFWNSLGFEKRDDLNLYAITVDEENL